MEVTLEDVREFVKSDKFAQFLLNNTTDFVVAAFILQSLLDIVEEKSVLVSKSKLVSLVADSEKLEALENAGVDNWCGYDETRLDEEFSDWEDYAANLVEKGEY